MRLLPVDDQEPNFHDDIDTAFAPLIKATNRNTDVLGQYMYMYHDQNDVHHYKHKYSRDYVHLDNQGNILDGTIEEWKDDDFE